MRGQGWMVGSYLAFCDLEDSFLLRGDTIGAAGTYQSLFSLFSFSFFWRSMRLAACRAYGGAR